MTLKWHWNYPSFSLSLETMREAAPAISFISHDFLFHPLLCDLLSLTTFYDARLFSPFKHFYPKTWLDANMPNLMTYFVKAYWSLKSRVKIPTMKPDKGTIMPRWCCPSASPGGIVKVGEWMQQNTDKKTRRKPAAAWQRSATWGEIHSPKRNPHRMDPKQQCQCPGEAKSKPRPQFNTVAGLKLFNHSLHYSWLNKE